MIILYSTGCPKCNVLKTKLKQKNIPYEEITDVEEIQRLGITNVPVLKISDTEMLSFVEANQYINKL